MSVDKPATHKPSKFDWLWPSIAAVLIMKFFGIAGGLVVYGSYFWLRPRIGNWGAVAVSSAAGLITAMVLMAIIRNQ